MPRRKLNKDVLPEDLRQPIYIDALSEPNLIGGAPYSGMMHAFKQDLFKRDLFIANIRRKKLDALGEFYNLDPKQTDYWQRLCEKMAIGLLDGFQVVEKGKRHRKEDWNAALLYLLWYEVEQLKEQGNSLKTACAILSEQDPWKNLVNQNVISAENRIRSLSRHYKDSESSSFVKFIKNIQKDTNSPNTALETYKMLSESFENPNK